MRTIVSETDTVQTILDKWEGFMCPDIQDATREFIEDMADLTAEDYNLCQWFEVDHKDTDSGFFVRLSASGYLDCTDWEYVEDEEGLRQWLLNEAYESGLMGAE